MRVMAETTDPDRGKAKGDSPSVAEQTAKLDLNVRARKLKHMQEQSKMVEDANALTRYVPPADEG